ncbi:formate dehydrogenase, cytochrome b556(fdo) subunit [bacterium BMS3Abin05]|nr:formate dehydrogenase, cytochrome b556(fdo) subunit [bacterium BMS3Abin05]HDZ12955.1 hypothetical protein [Bacteroidota bacterium]
MGKTGRVLSVSVAAFVASVVLLLFGPLQQPLVHAQENQECLACHGAPDFSVKGKNGKEISLYVNAKQLANSIHAGFSCTDCHSDATQIPHLKPPKRVSCAQCHEDQYAAYAKGIHGRAHLSGMKDAPTCTSCHGTHNIEAPDNPASTVSKINQPKTCAKCHGNPKFNRKHNIPVFNPTQAYLHSIHSQELLKGNDKAATCSDCHEAHDLLPASNPDSKIYRKNVPETCGRCHYKQFKQYIDSIHGQALLEGANNAPNCTDCHGEHAIKKVTSKTSPVSPENVSMQTCARCHANETINEKYGIPNDKVLSYENSYHGLAVQGKSTIAANCTSCHGVHNIYPAWDPRSTVNVANLDRTCGKCHPGASKRFASIPVHQTRSLIEAKAESIITKIYILLIISVIGSMFLHNFLIWLQAVIRKYRKLSGEPSLTRFNKNMIIQHFILFLSFTTLAITGFALKFPDAFWVKMLHSIGMTEIIRKTIHHTAGTILIAASIYHFFWLFLTRRGRVELRYMLPVAKDVSDAVHSVEFYLGLRDTKPQYDKYDYTEKAEYWALIWGTVIMSITGLIMWFPVISANLFGGWVLPIATLFHYFEAILATLAILVWHFFFAIFHPSEYPMSLVGITGKVSCESCKKHHGRWYHKLMHREPEKVRRMFDVTGQCEELEEYDEE